jgi:hypothetical protein
LIRRKKIIVQVKISNELGWYSMLILINGEKTKAQDARIFEKKLPPTDSTINQVKIIVRAPKSTGKDLIQKILPSRRFINLEINAVRGGTEIYPKARWSAWSRYKNSSL